MEKSEQSLARISVPFRIHLGILTPKKSFAKNNTNSDTYHQGSYYLHMVEIVGFAPASVFPRTSLALRRPRCAYHAWAV